MLSTSAVKTVSLKMAVDLVEETEKFAKASHQLMSEYIREAVREKNERHLAERIKFLAAKFSSETDAMDKAFDTTVGDGLAQD